MDARWKSSRGEDSIEGGVDFFERLEVFEAADVGGAGIGGGFFGGQVALSLVGFLLRDGAGADEKFPAGGSDFGNVVVGLRGFEVGASLLELLVDFGRFNFGEELAFFYGGADVEVPALEVAVGAGIDGRVDEGGGVAGERDFLGRGVGDGMNDVDDGNGGFMRGLGDFRFGVHAGANSEEDDEGDDGDSAGWNPPRDARRGGRRSG